MNQPFKPPVIEEMLADAFVSISNLKSNPAAVVAEAQVRQVAILNRNKAVAYVISPQVWEYLSELHEDRLDAELSRERLEQPQTRIRLEIEDLV